ncbi:MAG: hypothetical protein DCF20_08255 [Pseudanabaena sp.]|nr:MAG: hypothetical protein DCF20_08255 [Pseudanabaena sp.]
MQSDAFPTPPIYTHQFQPRLVQDDFDQPQDGAMYVNYLMDEIKLLMTNCSVDESEFFWSATDQIKIKHRVIESMQKIERLFLNLVRSSTQDPEILSAVSESLLYTNNSRMNSRRQIDIPSFLKQQVS